MLADRWHSKDHYNQWLLPENYEPNKPPSHANNGECRGEGKTGGVDVCAQGASRPKDFVADHELGVRFFFL